MKKQINKIVKSITNQMEKSRIADYIYFLEQENYALRRQIDEIKKLNLAQVRENAQIRVGKAKVEKQLSELKYLDNEVCNLALPTRERIIEILKKELKICSDRQMAIDFNKIADEILRGTDNEISYEELSNPYLLTGEELKRAEEARKRGDKF